MSKPAADLQRMVVDLVRELPEASVTTAAAIFEAARQWSTNSTSSLPFLDRHASRWQALGRVAEGVPGCCPAQLAGLLRGAAAMAAACRQEARLEIAWTGPTPPLSNLRRTEQALLEVVNAARRELWVVSFAAHRVPSICAALVGAARRGCRVRLLLESEAESAGKLTSGGVDGMPSEVREACELYVWPREKRTVDERGRFGALHAKCALADGEVLFVGSANLTEFAFELNIELGVLVESAVVAETVERQLRWLVDSRTMVQIEQPL
ncbi:MAG: hypothetical protein JNK49_03210 [Planctomycetes bacterium]|nr:hypothetical protein [Planctomycetota bacterium]